ncbi:MAG TPA: ribosome small subunit-dependent GTPase A [Bacteroidales bacterium]|nr:ribosome small subunit-dependent GTPase A [Bacteroidales bacterium]
MQKKGRVIKSTGKEYEIVTTNGEKITAVIKGRLRINSFKSTNPIAIGDIVQVEVKDNNDKAFITGIEERKNFIIRKATKLSKQFQILAANIDQAFLMITFKNPRTSTTFTDRFLATAEAYRVPVILLFNKVDLLRSESLKEELFFLKNVYQSLGYSVIELSVTKGINIDVVKEKVKGKVSLLSGHSGTGKSSLIKALNFNINIEIGKLSRYHHSGQNTTSHSQMYQVFKNSYLIDTPGIKGFGLFDFKQHEIPHFFREIFETGRQCGFDDCTHTHERNCAVKQAVEEGRISITRYESYLDIFFDKNDKYRKPF